MAWGIAVFLGLFVGVGVAWVNLIDRSRDAYMEHRDDPDYWDWP